ncbi:hypothetical protein CLAFUW4_10645 [Fulvia fulva]|uniref:RING-type domain-containing protein n=1 Tax=Passalora fulva TaxID=5499 RepID=A0A9Q8P8B4_PASFU|nr:uncharacterized protein CLAFUR5_05258 [Fulvia fulva]KAK4615687.1 hypothetical protein CLAFUR4_10650 [Fulvia fulva]KAK4616693.1 hypothetical protein CLAFUR0_10594 [Fulvia fulva]UJO17040.1 hypothetical protein CLAFUR5_05258 [Fulvia fulva]WPV19378.1 hypothetical protein CLAFUW4_10645 [Fulvia fulva]WPV34411.1 hypothetical protein CLAFUW7_10647 [Fulvia fulva]
MPSRQDTIALLTSPATPPQDATCSICHDPLNDAVEVACGNHHVYCRKCITEWLEVGHTCPTCRVALHDEGQGEGEEEEAEFDEEEYRDALLDFIDEMNAMTSEELQFNIRQWVEETAALGNA